MQHCTLTRHDLPLVVGSRQWICASKAGHVEVVFDDHDVSHFKVLIEASSCVGQHHRLHTEQLEDAHRQCNLETLYNHSEGTLVKMSFQQRDWI